jgi:glycosyltransferase involved in cell wall biosynthesis
MPPEIASAHLAKLGIPADARFILHIGGNNWYKNRIGALRIFNALRRLLADPGLKLVMAGKPLTDALLTEASQLGLDRALLQITSPSDGELNALYSSAMLLLFPSLGEGFGWPIIEAQACGCPVVTSARPPMDEIAGSGAIFIDPSAPEAAASVIAGSLSRLDQLRDAGLENARRFDVNQMSLAYIRLYENIMHRQAGFDWCPRTDSNGPA